MAALEAEDEDAIVAAADSIDSALVIAAASVPKSASKASLALLKETRALCREVASLANA